MSGPAQVCVFDMSSVNARRYNRSLSNMFSGFFCLIDDPELTTPDGTFKSEVCCGYWTIDKLINYFKINHIGLVIISGQRIADHRVTIAAKKSGAKVVYKMHGLYVPHMRRGMPFYFKKMLKTFRTLVYCLDISAHERSASLFIHQILNFVLGNRRHVIMAHNILQPNYCIFWSKYWVDWHRRHYFFSHDITHLVAGNPDTLNVKLFNDANAITYIYQTLVEDGRISKEIMTSYYSQLKKIEEKLHSKILIKWHPRGDELIKEELCSMGFTVTDSVTQNSTWIGHYSSLLGAGPIYKNKVMVHELPGHPTPESIRNISSAIIPFEPEEKELGFDFGISNTESFDKAKQSFGDIYASNKEVQFLKKIFSYEE